MSKAIERFEHFWRRLRPDKERTRFIHPDDQPALTDSQAAEWALHLLPQPVNGNLRRAEVLILVAGARAGDDDALWAQTHPGERASMAAAQHANILQSHGPTDAYPFSDLDPRFLDHPGAAHWRGGARSEMALGRQAKKLASLAGELAHVWATSEEVAFRTLSHRIAVVHLLAYPAAGASPATPSLPRNLPSCQEAVALAHGLLAENQKLIVVPRSAKEWGFNGPADNRKNLVVYDAVQGLSASLGTFSAGGQAILKRLFLLGPTPA